MNRVVLSSPFLIKITLTLLLSACCFARAYELGEKCSTKFNPKADPWAELRAAEKAENWPTVVALIKVMVSHRCDNNSRWLSLADSLLHLNKRAEVYQIVSELYDKGFQFQTQEMSSVPALRSYLKSKNFLESSVGKSFSQDLANSIRRKTDLKSRLKLLKASDKPPETYISKGTCPFECCTYRDWTTLKTVRLVDRPRGIREVATAESGDIVRGLTGRIYVRPLPGLVIADSGPFKKDEIIFWLDYIGEDLFHVWRAGTVIEADGPSETCLKPNASCWAETNQPGRLHDQSDWWVEVRLKNGKVGWTNKTDSFGNMDACG